jgi:hypothetical protein
VRGAIGTDDRRQAAWPFVSYFWQVQDRNIWPVYYTNSVQTMSKMSLWEESGEVGTDYTAYKALHFILLDEFSKSARKTMTLYDVEHVFWFKAGKLPGFNGVALATNTLDAGETGSEPAVSSEELTVPPLLTLSDSYVPPIVASAPLLATNDGTMAEACARAGTTVERALEKTCNAAFTVIGYETLLLGQGKGRVPDGQALAIDESYAILWDAKARTDGYSMGTDDRAIREYISKQSRDLKKRRGLRNIYYVIVSSRFRDDCDELIRSLKMETDVNDVCLLEASALVAMVDQKLRSPLAVTLGPDGLQRLFTSSGIISPARVLEVLGI